jgi:hypothetical protein
MVLSLLELLLLSLLPGEDKPWLGKGVSFLPPMSPSCAFAVLASRHWLDTCWPACVARRLCTGEVKALVSTCLENQPGPGICGNALLVLHKEARGSRAKRRKRPGSAHFVCLALLVHHAGGDLHIQLHLHCGSPSAQLGFPD